MYTLFIGPPEKDAEWSDRGVDGSFRFIKRVWNLIEILEGAQIKKCDEKAEQDLLRKMHQTIKKVTEDIDGAFHFNTAISAIMELVNHIYAGLSEKGKGCYGKKCLKEVIKNMVILLAPFVPHIAEELHQTIGGEGSVFKANWPAYKEDMLQADEVEIPVQINGKLRSTINVSRGLDQEKVKEIVLQDEKISGWVKDQEIRKIIVLPDRLVNIVV